MRGAVNRLALTLFVFSVWTFGVAGALGPPAFAGDEQSEPETQRPYLSLHEVDVYLELKGDYRYNRIDTDSPRRYERGRSQTNRDWGFEERIGLKLGGAILDPGFITFSGDLNIALTQDHYEEFGNWFDTRRDADNDVLLLYDLRLNLFQGKKLSGTVYGLRQDNRISRRFQPSLDERRTGYGTTWTWADEKLPMELSFDYLKTERDGNRDARDDEEYTEAKVYYGVRWLIDDHHRLKLSYEHSETDQEYQGQRDEYETSRDLLRLEHEIEFGDAHQHTLQTVLRWQEESGDFARDLFEIGPQLTLRHSDTLQTSYRYQLNRERYAGLDVETHRADFQLTHQVYTNLTTTVDLFGLYEDVDDDVTTTQAGGSVDWQYNRKNRWGHLYANLALAYDTEDVRGDNGPRLVLNEAQTFRDPVMITLRNRNVIPASIIVTDTGNRRVFTPGVDYAVFRYDNVTRIARIRTGAIADGDTILVDYLYKTPADGRLDTVRVDFSLEQRFAGGLTPYYRFSFRHQEDDLSFGFADRADRTDHHRLGITYEAKRFTLGAEYEIFDDQIEPYDALHLSGLVHLIQNAEQSLDASSRFSRLFFEGGYDDRNVTMIDVGLDHRWRLSESMSTVERFAYRFESDSIAGDTHAWDVVVGLQYAMGDLFGELTVEYDRLGLPGSEDEDFGVYFRLRRDFRDVFAVR